MSAGGGTRTAEAMHYLASRLVTTVLIVLGAMLLLFTLSAVVPGDPATTLLGPQATPCAGFPHCGAAAKGTEGALASSPSPGGLCPDLLLPTETRVASRAGYGAPVSEAIMARSATQFERRDVFARRGLTPWAWNATILESNGD